VTTRERELATRIRAELKREVLALAAEGPALVDQYVESVARRKTRRPAAGVLHGKSHALVRELVLDAFDEERLR
jgi:hypothetical protein